MREIVRYEGRRRIRGALVLTIGLGLFSMLVIGLFPSIEAATADFEAVFESLPEAFQESFSASAYTTIEGFLSAEFYQFIWLLLFGLYMAYAAGGAIAGDVETGRMDLVLAAPISRVDVLVGKALSLFVPIVVLNLLIPLFVYGGVIAIGESLSLFDLLVMHVLSVPYLLVCAGIGLVLSVLVSRADIARRGGIAAIFLLFVVEAVTTGTDFDWLGGISPTRYYDPNEILVEQSYDLTGALILLGAAIALLLVSASLFKERDI